MKRGLLAAVAATLAWSLLYIFPRIIGDYTAFDLAVVSYAVAGSGALVILWRYRTQVKALTLRDWLTVGLLGFLGYIGYFFLITSAVMSAGPVLPPVMLGCVPIVLAIAGNLKSRSVPWRSISLPLLAGALGIMLVNLDTLVSSRLDASYSLLSVSLGILASLTAIGFWTGFGIINERALARRPEMNPLLWSALLIISCSIEMVMFLPVGVAMKLSAVVSQSGPLSGGWELLMSGVIQGLVATLGGAWAWSIAARKIPLALGGQLIASQTIYATIMGLMMEHRWPSTLEALGTVMVFVGVVTAINQFYKYARRTQQGQDLMLP
ncbi:DMT family transporter [Pokkaliibacter sp. CJK22405]|uniref:DMT family transporter n=1 Tax=Pokkaliibacter sp. CJK22405 TaxID=3384615 RepID=UPI00398561FF